jgi:hypothetical protein
VAIAIVNIQAQRREEPVLIALAIFGFVLYGVLCWLGWRLAQRFENRIGALWTLAVYLSAIAVLFLVATVVYLVLERVYLG